MTVIELKEKLIARINSINDIILLQHISDVIESHIEFNSKEIHVMIPGEIEAVEEGLAQLDRGEFISNEEANRRAEEWLNK